MKKQNGISKIISPKQTETMTDITMCNNEDWPLSYSCWRFNCPPSQFTQSYQKFFPMINKELDEIECEFYIKPPDNVWKK